MRELDIGTKRHTVVNVMDKPGEGGACHEYEVVLVGPVDSNMEAMAEAVHRAYLDKCSELGWPVKAENQIPYSELSENSKELDRTSVRAVLNNMEIPARVSFQNGPIKEAGVNGCHQEDLIAIVIDRLQSFQAGDFKCRENALALNHLEIAMRHLNRRTEDREKRGVEGTSAK